MTNTVDDAGVPLPPRPWRYSDRLDRGDGRRSADPRRPGSQGHEHPVPEPPARDLLHRARLRRERGRGDRRPSPRRHRGRRAHGGRPGDGVELRRGGRPHRRGLHGRRHRPEAAVARAQGGVPGEARHRGSLGPARLGVGQAPQRPLDRSRPPRRWARRSGTGSAPRRTRRSGTTAASCPRTGATPPTTRPSSTSSTGRSPRWRRSRRGGPRDVSATFQCACLRRGRRDRHPRRARSARPGADTRAARRPARCRHDHQLAVSGSCAARRSPAVRSA